MIHYYKCVPAAAVRFEVDGFPYAWVDASVTAKGVEQCEPRMVSAVGFRVKNGVAKIWIGCMGNTIAQRVNLPWSVEFEHIPDM